MTRKKKLSRRVFLSGAAGYVGSACTGAAPERGKRAVLGGRFPLSEPGPMVPPVPAVLLTVKGMPGDPDEISVLWTFIVNGNPPQIGVSAEHAHIAGGLIAHHGEFVLNVPVADIMVPFDRVDMNSSRVGRRYPAPSVSSQKSWPGLSGVQA